MLFEYLDAACIIPTPEAAAAVVQKLLCPVHIHRPESPVNERTYNVLTSRTSPCQLLITERRGVSGKKHV